MTSEDVYYGNEWMCEIPGVAGSLERVARQLADGVESDPGVWIVEPQAVPSDHAATKVRYYWVAVEREENGYSIPLDLPGELHAIAWGDGQGWSPDMLIFDREHARVLMEENGTEGSEFLVCRGPEVPGVLELREGPIAQFRAAT